MKTGKAKENFDESLYDLRISQMGLEYERKGYEVTLEYPLNKKGFLRVDMIAVNREIEEVLLFEIKRINGLEMKGLKARVIKEKMALLKIEMEKHFPGFKIIPKLVLIDPKENELQLNSFDGIERILHWVIVSRYFDQIKDNNVYFTDISHLENVSIHKIDIIDQNIKLSGSCSLFIWVINEIDGSSFKNIADPIYFDFNIVLDKKAIGKKRNRREYLISESIAFSF